MAFELKEIYQLGESKIYPIVISVNGLIHEKLVVHTKELGLCDNVISAAQKAVVLGTSRIVRSFLQTT